MNVTIFLKFQIFLSIIFLPFLFSCEKVKHADSPAGDVLKFRDGVDYSDNVYVLISEDKKRMVGYPAYKENFDNSAYDVYKGYHLLKINYGINTGYLSLTFEEYGKVKDTISRKTIESLIIDRDPYSEFYYDEDNYLLNHCPECEDMDTIWPGYDTAKFHRLVDNGELEIHLKRVK
ncbi:hypothetical protein ACFLTE_09060 [Bacteroidota bacterium]